MREIVKCPLADGGSIDIHRRPMFDRITVSEQRYFTRCATGKAKPEVLR